jgi:hypothetical protein
MSLARLISLLACTVLVGCGAASEGGVTGTGISAISGNVAAVTEEITAQLGVTLPFPIRVAVAGLPGLEGITDTEGAFQLAGRFSGEITLLFTNADDGTEIGPLVLEVPAGSQTVLENIEIRTAAPLSERVRPQAVRQFDVFGRADLVECEGDGSGTVLLTDDGRPPRQFMISLTVDTEIVDRAGAPLVCEDIAVGAALRIEGLLLRRDQILVALTVVVAAPRPPQPGPSPRPERLRGVVRAVLCERGLIEIDQRAVEPVRRVVRLTERTAFQCASDTPAPCDCSAIAIGAPIAVSGTIVPARPGQVLADVVFLQATAVPVDLVGTITRLACGSRALAINVAELGQGLRVALTETTEIRCGAGVTCRCADLRPRQRVRVQGHRPPEGGSITAVRIAVLR